MDTDEVPAAEPATTVAASSTQQSAAAASTPAPTTVPTAVPTDAAKAQDGDEKEGAEAGAAGEAGTKEAPRELNSLEVLCLPPHKPSRGTHERRTVSHKAGDWYCQSCGMHNFSKRTTCLRCLEGKAIRMEEMLHAQRGAMTDFYGGGGGKGGHEPAMMGNRTLSPILDGEWYCPRCRQLNLPRKLNCKNCLSQNPFISVPSMGGKGMPPYPEPYRDAQGAWGGAGFGMGGGGYYDEPHPHLPYHHGPGQGYDMPHPMQGGYGGGPHGPYDPNAGWDPSNEPPSDWDCWVCGSLNKKKRMKCKGCATAREKALPRSGGGVPRPGDWFCMQCQNVNFNKRIDCRMCHTPRADCSNEIVLRKLRAKPTA